MDLALNNLQKLIGHKTQQTKQTKQIICKQICSTLTGINPPKICFEIITSDFISYYHQKNILFLFRRFLFLAMSK